MRKRLSVRPSDSGVPTRDEMGRMGWGVFWVLLTSSPALPCPLYHTYFVLIQL